MTSCISTSISLLGPFWSNLLSLQVKTRFFSASSSTDSVPSISPQPLAQFWLKEKEGGTEEEKKERNINVACTLLPILHYGSRQCFKVGWDSNIFVTFRMIYVGLTKAKPLFSQKHKSCYIDRLEKIIYTVHMSCICACHTYGNK
jgi:hypothetical protein